MSLQAREAELALGRLRGAVKIDAALGAVSLTASYFAGGVLAAGALVAARDAIKRRTDFRKWCSSHARSFPDEASTSAAVELCVTYLPDRSSLPQRIEESLRMADRKSL
jgi:hypothetical protein